MLRSVRLSLVTCLSLPCLAGVACGEAHDAPRAPSIGGSSGAPSSIGGSSGATSSIGGSSGAASSVGGGGPSNGGGTSGVPGGAGTALGDAGESTGGDSNREVSLLVFSRTAEYRHDSIPAGVAALTLLAAERGWQLAATEDPSRFSDATLASYDAVIFLSTTGDVLDDEQQAAFERFIRSGKGFVGIHSATDTEYDWSWYGELVGAYFREHPAVQAADVLVEDTTSAATAGLPSPWRRTDEWYAFKTNPRPDVQVLLSLDEASYTPGASNMAGDHPIAWRHEHDGGRAFYTALGHTSESYSDAAFMGHVAGGIAWTLRL